MFQIARVIFKVLLLVLVVTLQAKSQTSVKPKVFIEFNNESEGWINEYLDKKRTWDIVGSPKESNVIFRLQMSENTYKAKAKLFILDSQTDETIWTSETISGQSSAFNGYAPKKNATKKLVDFLEENFDKGKVNFNHLGANKSVSASSEKRSVADELIKIKQLLDSGAISKEEFDSMKKKLLDQ